MKTKNPKSKPATSANQKAAQNCAPRTYCADAALLEALYAILIALRGINGTMAYTSLFQKDHVEDDWERNENVFKKIEEWRRHNESSSATPNL
jgi:hypothetical protein